MGYTGGKSENPTYQSVCRGDGHTEALRLEYDPDIISYEELMRIFYSEAHGGRCKAQYKSAVWAQNKEQEEVAKRVAKAAGSDVPVLEAHTWYDAEEYHQKYFSRRGRL